MGTNYKTGRLVFDAEASTNAGAVSRPAIIKSASRAAILVENTGANMVDVLIEVKAPSVRDGGINSLDEITDNAGWHRFHVLDDDGAPTPLVMSVGPNETMALDLSVFAFSAVRLIADSSIDDSHGEITATVSWGS